MAIESRDDEGTLALVEEGLSVGKAKVNTGRVDVRTITDTFQQTVDVELQHDATSVTRVPIGREVAVVPQIRTEGDVTIVPVLEEILVIEKRLFLKEEIHIRRTSETEHVESLVTLRRQRAVVERQDATGNPASQRETTRKQND